jgi:gamma-glutamyltranspeptidase / glutathione hydrolase
MAPFRTTSRVVLVALFVGVSAQATPPFRGGAIATQHRAASEAGLEMLNKGGNAVDAAVAAAFVLAVVAPYHSGLGGGGFAVLHDAASGTQKALDFREVAPKAATRDMFVRLGQAVPELSQNGGLAVAVPGAVAGYLELIRTRGKLKPSVVLAPAIRAARDGFWVTPKFQSSAKSRLECLRADAEAARIFLRPAALKDAPPEVPAIGTLLKQPELARVLGAIAARGEKAFYEGATAKAIASSVQASGGVLTEEDLKAYKVRWREPLEGSFRGHRFVTMPPPSAGGLAVVQLLGMLELAGPAAGYRDVAALHRFIESLRRVYVDRAKHLGDPAFTEIPMGELTSREHLQSLLASIDPNKATSSMSLLPSAAIQQWPQDRLNKPLSPLPVPPKPPSPDAKNTSHISVVDKAGNAVALTTTVNFGFGSCVVVKGVGVVMNDEMDDFAAKPMTANVYGLVTGEANAVAPGKIPLSSMSPTLVFHKDSPKEVYIAVGSPGGPTIPTTVVQVVSNIIDHKMDVLRAVGAGRVHHQYLPDEVLMDRYSLDVSTVKALEAKGHTLRLDNWGDAEAVVVDPVSKLRYAGSDARNEGVGMGQE